jgi:hypothetical protein
MQQRDIYRIRVQGHLDQRWAEWFDGLTMTHEPNGETLFYGAIEDQAALHGTLNKIRDLGIPLISVQRLDPHDDGDASSTFQ